MGRLCILLAAACAAEEAPAPARNADTAEPAPFACAIGVPGEDGAYTALSEGDPAELVLGFQGFLFVSFLARAEAGAPALVDAALSLDVEGDEPWSGHQPAVALRAVGGGDAVVSDELRAFLSGSDVGFYDGRGARVALRLEGDGQRCTAEARVILTDADPCIHTDDAPICPDTGEAR